MTETQNWRVNLQQKNEYQNNSSDSSLAHILHFAQFHSEKSNPNSNPLIKFLLDSMHQKPLKSVLIFDRVNTGTYIYIYIYKGGFLRYGVHGHTRQQHLCDAATLCATGIILKQESEIYCYYKLCNLLNSDTCTGRNNWWISQSCGRTRNLMTRHGISVVKPSKN